MPKEKSSILAENNYTELTMKDNLKMGVSVSVSGAGRKEASPNDTAAPTTGKQQQQQHDSNKSASNNLTTNHVANATQKQQQQHNNIAATTTAQQNGTTNTDTTTNVVVQQQQPLVPNPTKIRTAHDFRFGKSIGEGSFSTVYLAKDIHTRKEYASKYRTNSDEISGGGGVLFL